MIGENISYFANLDPNDVAIETYKGLIAVLILLLTWGIGNRIAVHWAILQKQKETEISISNELYTLYGNFFSMWKLWRYCLTHKNDKTMEQIITDSYISEGKIEAILVKIATEKKLNYTQLEILGRFRQAYQRLRECIQAGKDLPWMSSDNSEYLTFKFLSYMVSCIVQSNIITKLPLWKRIIYSIIYLKNWIFSFIFQSYSTYNKNAIRIISSNYWENHWVIPTDNMWEILGNFESPNIDPIIRGHIQHILGEYKEAIASFNEALASFNEALPKDQKKLFADAWYSKGRAILEIKYYDRKEAIKAYEEAVKAFNNAHSSSCEFRAPAYFWKGIALNYFLKNYKKAVIEFDNVIEIDPQAKNAWYEKGIAQKNLKDYEGAIKSFDNVIEINPQDNDVWIEKGICSEMLGKCDEFWTCQGTAQISQCKYAEALQSFDNAISLNKNYADAWVGRSNALKALCRAAEADEAFAKAKELVHIDLIPAS
jgi:tetratricopeptide (TPR) repeat protein